MSLLRYSADDELERAPGMVTMSIDRFCSPVKGAPLSTFVFDPKAVERPGQSVLEGFTHVDLCSTSWTGSCMHGCDGAVVPVPMAPGHPGAKYSSIPKARLVA